MNKIHVSDKAQEDLAGIKAYISDELGNPTAAKTTLRKITADIRALKDHAMLGAPVVSDIRLLNAYRFLVSGNYLTFYRVLGTDVYIDRILYGRRNYVDILLRAAAEKQPEQ